MVDLRGQYEQIREDVDRSVSEVLETASFINGPAVGKFQKELGNYLDIKHVIPCANGTDALQIALMGLGLEQGDEVITTDFTFASTVEVIVLLKLKPVLVDINPDDFNISIKAIEGAITPKTKAIIPVHLFGQCADMESILNIAKKHRLYVVEDTAQAIGAEYTFSDGKKAKAGTMGNIGTTSFFPSKNLGCYGDGGAVFTNNADWAYRIRGIVNHGMYKRYYHDVVGVNSRLDSIQAAVLSCKLPHLDSYNQKRRTAAEKYTERLKQCSGVETPIVSKNSTHVFHQYTLKVHSDRDELVKHLSANNIPTGVYYPVPLHRQQAYKTEGYNDNNFVVTNTFSQKVVSLPMHTELKDDQIDFIASKIIEFFN